MEKQGVELINCGHHISVADINRIYHAKTELPESSKRLFNKAVQFVAKTDDSILRDCALELDDRNNQLHIMFYAGDLGNQYVMALVSFIAIKHLKFLYFVQENNI